MQSRRKFLQNSSLISMSPFVPTMLSQTAVAASDEKILVVVQMDGGNDGINTVVPFGDDGYRRARKKLFLKTKDLHKLNDHVGLYRQMKSAKELLDDGRLSIIQGVGYPKPDRSHFRSMKISQTARLDEADHTGSGWLSSALDARLIAQTPEANLPPTHDAHAIFVGKEENPSALWGRRSSAID